LRETRQRLDSQSVDIKKKENQLKDLQTKLEQGEGCEFSKIQILLEFS
jgi:hypothetical protein